MNRNRKKTVLPLEYQIESFFKKVLYLNHELITKKIDKNSKPLDIENLDLETLIYEGMKRYEELINIFKINSEKESKIIEKEEVKEEKKHKKPFTKNKTDAFNFGKRRSENIIDYRFNMYDNSNKNEQNDDLDNSRTSKKNLKFGSSYDKDLKYNFKGDKNEKRNIFKKSKRNSMVNKKDIFSHYFKNNNEDKNTSQNKDYNFNNYEKTDKNNKYDNYDNYDKYDNYNEYNKENQYDVKGGIEKYDKYDDEYEKNKENNRYDEYEKKVKYEEYPKNDKDYDEKYPNNEYDNKNKEDKYKVNDNKENYNKTNIDDENKEKEEKIKTNKINIKEKFKARLSLNKETKFEAFKRNITDDKYFKNINMNKKENSMKGRYKYKYKYLGNKDKNVSEVSDSKQNRWMKKKTNINNSIISRSKNGDFEESQEISRNTWLKKRMPITYLHKNVFGNTNRNKITRNNLIKSLKMKENSLGKRYEKHDFKDFEFDNYKDKLSRSNNYESDILKSSINIREKKERKNFNLNENDNDNDANKLFVNVKKRGSDIYNINYGKIVNKNMFINVYKTEPKNNNNYPENQKFVEKRGSDGNNMYNYSRNYCNIYQDEDDDDNKLGEYGTKLVGKEMLKKNIRDKEERERMSKQNLNIYSSI